jgi:hypothetical protein
MTGAAEEEARAASAPTSLYTRAIDPTRLKPDRRNCYRFSMPTLFNQQVRKLPGGMLVVGDGPGPRSLLGL